jgi:hypothetical protein
VGWGTIPLDHVFALLRGYTGTVVHEYRYNLFLPYAEEDYASARRLIAPLK